MKVPGDPNVASKINFSEPRPARVTAASPVRGTPSPTSDNAGPKPANVHVTGAARNLAALEQSARAQPPVDELRVAAVRQRLQDGSYDIDPQRIADRLLRMEADLAGNGAFAGNPLR